MVLIYSFNMFKENSKARSFIFMTLFVALLFGLPIYYHYITDVGKLFNSNQLPLKRKQQQQFQIKKNLIQQVKIEQQQQQNETKIFQQLLKLSQQIKLIQNILHEQQNKKQEKEQQSLELHQKIQKQQEQMQIELQRHQNQMKTIQQENFRLINQIELLQSQFYEQQKKLKQNQQQWKQEELLQQIQPKQSQEKQKQQLPQRQNVLENLGSLVNCPSYSVLNEKKIHIISSIIYFLDPKYKDHLLYKNERKPTSEEIFDRIKEIVDVIQQNLNHEAIGTLHLLVETESAFKYINTIQFKNQSKLFLYRNISITPKNILNIALRCFPNRNVLYLSQDITIGQGWSKLNLENFKKERLLYALTRHSSSKCRTEKVTCDLPYRGSHDAYFFYVYKYVDVFADTDLADVEIVSYGIENILIGWFKNVYKLTPKNPCQQLITYHHHCVPIREANRKTQQRQLNTLANYSQISKEILTA